VPNLTEIEIKNAKPGDKPRKLYDKLGLFLIINPDASAYWRVRYTIDGRERLKQVGVYRSAGSDTVKMRLAEARKRRDELRETLRKGEDPSANKQAERAQTALETEQKRAAAAELRQKRRADDAATKAVADDARRTVRAVCEEWIETYRAGWSVKHEAQNRQSFRDHVYPAIGDRPIRSVGTADILGVLSALTADSKAETARRVRQRLGGVFQHAALRGHIDRDPVPLIGKEFTKLRATALKVNPARKFPCISRDELPALLRVMRGYPGIVVRLALWFTALTLARTTEVRAATWGEFTDLDGEAPMWRVPPERMKARRPHDVPLSRQACDVLRELKQYTGDGPYLFPHERKRDRPLSENGMLYALWSMGYRGRMTGHGFRSLGSTMLNEAGFRSAVVEKALAHEQGDRVEAAYNRAEYLQERREMLKWYANALDTIERGEAFVGASPIRLVAA
jgi:integrase